MILRGRSVVLSALAILALIALAGCGGGGDGTPPPPANNNPVIQSLTVPNTAFPGSNVSVSASASDPDGDSLTYSWTASSGAIAGSGASATWTAPLASGDYTITLRVTDGRGGQAQRTATIAVEDIGPPPPPPF